METKEGGRKARASKGTKLFIKIKIVLTAPSHATCWTLRPASQAE